MKKLQTHVEICPVCHVPSVDYQCCYKCKTNDVSYAGIVIAFNYTGLVKKLILCLKYYHKYTVADYLASKLALLIQCNQQLQGFLDKPGDVVVTHVPSHRFRKHMIKGYNQSQLLAQKLAGILQVHHVNLLKKNRMTRSQTTLQRKDRLTNLQNAFVFESDALNQLQDKKIVIIVDDITTTGSTIKEMTRVIKGTYPHIVVWGAVLARSNG